MLDSWCWIEYCNGTKAGKEVGKYIDTAETLFISVINLAEVYKKYIDETNENYADKIVTLMMSRCFLIPVEPTTALNAAKINAKMKWGLGDSLVYASAKSHNLKLVTGDPHFKNEKAIVYLGS